MALDVITFVITSLFCCSMHFARNDIDSAWTNPSFEIRVRSDAASKLWYIRTVLCATMPDLDWSKCPVVESVPGKVSGAWVLKGTRMPVSAIFENIEAGASIDDILEWFEGLDRTQVEAILEFVARSLDRAPEYMP